jgi:hypothetical protein
VAVVQHETGEKVTGSGRLSVAAERTASVDSDCVDFGGERSAFTGMAARERHLIDN